MKTIASRTLAASPGKVWEDLEREGAVIITKDGVPRSIMVPASDATLLEDVQELVFARARKAVRAIRARAARTWPHRRPSDEDDVMFLEVALHTAARTVVTGNLKPFPPGSRGPVPVLSPRAAWKRFVALGLT